jgi:hypothetical protein
MTMAPPTVRRRGRIAVSVMLLALAASLIPTASAMAAFLGTLATGGSAISADEFGTSTFTTLTGPQIGEAAAGDLINGSTTVLNVPAGFKFNAGAGNASSGGSANCDLVGNLVVTATQATYTVTHASTVPGCILTFVGLQVQPTAGAGAASGNITKTGTSTAPGGATNYGTLTKVPGAVAQLVYITQPSANSNGGTVFAAQPAILARDQFSNNVPGVPVTLSITPGTGATGAALTCTDTTVNTTGAGLATFAGCKIDLAGQYKLRGTNGSITTDSGLFNINVGPAAKIAFTSYPAASTTPVLNPQPTVAVQDAGGNTVTTFPTNPITIAINKNAGTFSCTSSLTVNTVNGVAAFTGCSQTTADSGYTLTATIFFATPAIGPAFAVTPPTLAFVAGPGAPVAGQPFPTSVQVAIQNGGTTLTTGISATVTLAIGTNPSGGVLTCAGGTAVGTISGVATFTGCSIDKPGTGYTLTATASSVLPPQTISPATSTAFNVGNNISPASLSITTFCGSPTPKSTSGPNQCSPDSSKSPPQANIKLPQNLDEGVWLQAHVATNGANRPLTFEVSKDQATWNTIGTATTDASGNASVFYRPSDNRYYRVTFSGGADLGAATSPTVRVVVRALGFLRPAGCTSTSPCRVRLGAERLFTVTARPNRPELPQQAAVFTVQRKVGSSWINVDIDALVIPVSKSTGTALFSLNFNVRGTWRLRVNLAPTSVNANSFPTGFEYYAVS